MSDNGFKKQSGKYSQPYDLSISNPEKVDKHYDWWDELCKAHGAENHWPKKKPKEKDE